MSEKIIHQITITETDDGYRIEIKGDSLEVTSIESDAMKKKAERFSRECGVA